MRYGMFSAAVAATCLCVAAQSQTPDGMKERWCAVGSRVCELMADAAQDIGETSSEFGAQLKSVTELFGVEWPEGSSSEYVKTVGNIRAVNTPANLDKLDAALDELNVKPIMVEAEIRLVEAGREALDASGYFDTNRVDGAEVFASITKRDDVKILESVRATTHSGEELVIKHLTEFIYPSDFDVQLSYGAAQGTNAEASVFATVEPQSFTMHEAGLVVHMTPNVPDVGGQIEVVKFMIRLVDEPEWKDFGAKAKWTGAATYDLPMEQPFFPVRLDVDASFEVASGRTMVFGGVDDPRKHKAGRFVLAFVTLRLVNVDGSASAVRAVPGRFVKRRMYEDEEMESRTYLYAPAGYACALCCGEKVAITPKEIVERVAEREKEWKEFFYSCANVEWPEGSGLRLSKTLRTLWVKNTTENLEKLDRTLREMYCDCSIVETDFRIFDVGREALKEAGYFDTNRVDGAELLARLSKSGDAKLVSAPRVVTFKGEKAVVKGVTEYVYPTDYDVYAELQNSSSDSLPTIQSGVPAAAVEPQSFMMREAGIIVEVTPDVSDDGNSIFMKFDVNLVGEPEWKDFGAKAKWSGAATYDLPMEQPFFPVRLEVDSWVSFKPGCTQVFGGGRDRQKGGGEDRFILLFVTPRLLNR